jgi:TRAP-type C4-dicarboxylate transport system permease small subunit
MFRRALISILEVTRTAARAVVVLAFATIVIVVFGQVVSRFLFNAPFSWSEELARYLQVWLIMVGSAVCLRKGLHLTVDYAVHSLPESSTKRNLHLLSLAAILFFLGIVFVSGISLITATLNQRTPALQIPIWVVYLAIPVGSFLMFLESIGLVLTAFDGASPPMDGDQ